MTYGPMECTIKNVQQACWEKLTFNQKLLTVNGSKLSELQINTDVLHVLKESTINVCSVFHYLCSKFCIFPITNFIPFA